MSAFRKRINRTIHAGEDLLHEVGHLWHHRL
jgi:hypothetical protein